MHNKVTNIPMENTVCLNTQENGSFITCASPQATQHQAEFAPGQLLLPQSSFCPLSKLSLKPKQKHWMKVSAGTKAEPSHNGTESLRDWASFYMCKTFCTHTSHKTSLEQDENSPNCIFRKLFCWFLTSIIQEPSWLTTAQSHLPQLWTGHQCLGSLE